MGGWRAALLAILANALPAAAPAARAGPPAAPPSNPCRRAGAAAEQAFGLPSGLLAAIAQVESGRFDPFTGQTAPWPWTINVAGAGRFFGTKPEAVAAVQGLQLQGIRSIDAGCFQINLMHHRRAFANLEAAFDPDENARYAARFLASLRDRTGGWQMAVAFYHSATPAIGGPYRDRVLAGWGGMVRAWPGMDGGPGMRGARAPDPHVILVSARAAAVRVWGPGAQHPAEGRVLTTGRQYRLAALPRIIEPSSAR